MLSAEKSFHLQIITLLKGGTTGALQTGYQGFKAIQSVAYAALPDRHEAHAGHILIKWKSIPRAEEKVEGLRE